jgi:hypothetical protein
MKQDARYQLELQDEAPDPRAYREFHFTFWAVHSSTGW